MSTRLEEIKRQLANLEAEKKRLESQIPIISWADSCESKDRIIISLTPDMIRHIKNGTVQLAVDERGYVCDFRRRHKTDLHFYDNITPIFGSFNATKE